MGDLSCYFTTFNCGRTLVDVDYFATHLFNGLKTNLPPDLVVLSLQEIAPLGYSFLGGSLLAPYLTRFMKAVNVATSKHFEAAGDYREVIIRNVGMTAIMLLARPEIVASVRWIETAGVGTGVWEMGNKGAVAARIGIAADDEGDEEAMLTFVAAHLAPMEWNWELRNQDWKTICEGLVFEKDAVGGIERPLAGEEPEAEPLLSASEGVSDTVRSLFSPVSQVFVAGDLNYRTADAAPSVEAWKSWPQPEDTVSNVKNYSNLFAGDQLTRETHKKKTLHNLAESEITFPPTYKYSTAAQQDAALGVAKHSTNHETRSSLWAKHRVPSWCDRILYLATAPPDVHSYTALPVQPTSDHRPVSLSFSIPLAPIDPTTAAVEQPFPIRRDWRAARAAARRYEFVVGLAAYLTLTWEGEALLAGSIVGLLGGYLALRAMLGL
jgi:hypothetical protein